MGQHLRQILRRHAAQHDGLGNVVFGSANRGRRCSKAGRFDRPWAGSMRLEALNGLLVTKTACCRAVHRWNPFPASALRQKSSAMARLPGLRGCQKPMIGPPAPISASRSVVGTVRGGNTLAPPALTGANHLEGILAADEADTAQACASKPAPASGISSIPVRRAQSAARTLAAFFGQTPNPWPLLSRRPRLEIHCERTDACIRPGRASPGRRGQ